MTSHDAQGSVAREPRNNVEEYERETGKPWPKHPGVAHKGEPKTEAGRALHNKTLSGELIHYPDRATCSECAAILAIEAEAAKPWREAARDAFLPLPKQHTPNEFADWNGITERGFDRLQALLDESAE